MASIEKAINRTIFEGHGAMSESAFFYLWTVLMVLTISYMGLFLYAFSYLKDRHNAMWLALGSPSFLNNSPLNSWRAVRFILSAAHRSLGDSRLTTIVTALRALFIADMLIFLVLLGMFPLLRAS